MAFQILPQEFNLLTDRYIIRTRVPVSELKDDMVLLRVRNANLSAGDRIVVQCMSHAYDTLLHEAEYRVVSRKDSLKVVEVNDRDTRQINDVAYVIARMGDWWASPLAKPIDETAIGMDFVQGEARWNVGSKSYDIIVNGNVVASIADKEMAHAIARGDSPLPKAA